MYMFSYRMMDGNCGNICRNNLQQLVVEANRILPVVSSYSFYAYDENHTGVSVLREYP